jgi:enoyl-CoA hydratase/carnithine racemase
VLDADPTASRGAVDRADERVIAFAGDLVACHLDPTERTATIRLDRPPVNALDEQAWTELGAAVDAVPDHVGAVVVWGGTNVFAAGADIRHLQTLSSAGMRRLAALAQDSVSRLEALPQVTIAAIDGYALGGGCEIALAADFRFAAEDVVLGLPEVLLGLLPGAGGTQRLGRLVGLARAKDLILTGRHVKADEALAMGLVDRVVPDAHAAATEAAAVFARGPYSLRLAKEAVNAAADVSLAEGLRLELALVAEAFASDDVRIGLQAFLDNRMGEAPFTGR